MKIKYELRYSDGRPAPLRLNLAADKITSLAVRKYGEDAPADVLAQEILMALAQQRPLLTNEEVVVDLKIWGRLFGLVPWRYRFRRAL